MTTEEMRNHAEYIGCGGDYATAQSWDIAAEICARLDVLIAATGTRILPIVGEIGDDNADSE